MFDVEMNNGKLTRIYDKRYDAKVDIIKDCFSKGDVISALKGVYDFKLCSQSDLKLVLSAYEILRSKKIVEQHIKDDSEIVSNAIAVLEQVLR